MTDLKADYTNKDTGLTEKDEFFLSVLFHECGGDFQSAMTRAGLNESPNSVRRRLKTHIQEETKNFLAASSAKAAVQLVNTFNDPSLPGVKNVISAAKEVLDRGGVHNDEVKKTENYVFILPAKTSGDVQDED